MLETCLQSLMNSAATMGFITVLGFVVGIGVVLLVLLLPPGLDVKLRRDRKSCSKGFLGEGGDLRC